MERPGSGARLAAAGLAGAALTLLAPAGAGAAGLTPADRKAVDITSIDADSTSDAAFTEIKFKGKIEEELGTGGLKKARVTIELVPESGATTMITDRGSSRRPKEGRSGTPGRFDVVRNGRLMMVLVEELPAPAAQVVVTTSGPAGGGSGAGIRGDVGEVQPENFDELAEEAKFINSDESARFARERVDEKLDKAEEDLEKAESDADKTIDDIDRAQRDLIDAKGGGAARDARERLERFKAKLKKLNQRRKTLRENIKILKRWSGILFAIQGGAKFQCNDFVDNDGDGLTDHPADPGCVNAVDNDEKDETVPLACPAPGQTMGGIAIINTPQSNTISSVVLRQNATGQEVLNAPVEGESAGPSPLPGAICGPGVNVFYEYRQYTDGTPFGLPNPPPGDRAFRILVDAQNPTGSGNPGGQDATLQLAIGTTPQ